MKVIFCIPGRTFSDRFLQSWTNLIKYLPSINVEWELVSEYSPIIQDVRQRCVGKAISKDYDYIMWIDSDIVFKPQHFFKLLEHDKDIVSGLYLKKPHTDSMADIPTSFACFVGDDYRNLMTHEANGELINVRANGMGWMLVKKGVYEKIDYPWFGMINHHGEDLSFQLRAKDVGFDSYVDTSIIVGHEKGVVLDLF